MNINAKIIHAFSINGVGGNPAGLVLDADKLNNQQKQLIAKKLGYTETAFVSHSIIADFKLDFFTPVKQIPHCGHATIATFNYLKKIGAINSNNSSKETVDGTRQIFFKDGLAFMEQRKPIIYEVTDEVPNILESLELSETDLMLGKSPAIVNTGNNFLMIPVNDEKKMADIKPNMAAISAISEPHNLVGFYPFALTEKPGLDATTRMFGPYYGIEEESGTGMAAGPLACYLYQVFGIKQQKFQIEQGRFMSTPSPSLLHVELVVKEEQVEKLYVGGDAYVSKEINITI